MCIRLEICFLTIIWNISWVEPSANKQIRLNCVLFLHRVYSLLDSDVFPRPMPSRSRGSIPRLLSLAVKPSLDMSHNKRWSSVSVESNQTNTGRATFSYVSTASTAVLWYSRQGVEITCCTVMFPLWCCGIHDRVSRSPAVRFMIPLRCWGIHGRVSRSPVVRFMIPLRCWGIHDRVSRSPAVRFMIPLQCCGIHGRVSRSPAVRFMIPLCCCGIHDRVSRSPTVKFMIPLRCCGIYGRVSD